jgi:hypothetical protein
MTPREFIHQPEAGVVPCACVFGARVAEPDDDLEWMSGHGPVWFAKATTARRMFAAPL